jgi:hypothetical protein
MGKGRSKGNWRNTGGYHNERELAREADEWGLGKERMNHMQY